MADDTLIPSTPGSFGRDGKGVDLHGAIQHVESLLGWLKDHLIQSGDTSVRQYETSLAQTGSVRQAPDPPLATPSGMTPSRLAQAASRPTTQYQRGNPGGPETAPSPDDPVADLLKQTTMPNPVRASAWDAYYQTNSPDEFAARVKDIAIPKQLKADLFDLKVKTARPRITVSPAIEADARLGPHTMTDSEPSWFENLLSALKPLAQPRTVDDIGHLLMTPTDATRGALSIPAVSRTVTRAADAAGHGVEAVGTGLEAAGQSQPVKVLGQGGALYAAYRGDLTKAAIALLGPSVLTTTGRIFKATGKAMQSPVRPFNGLPIEPYMANRSGYVAGTPAAEGALPLQGSVDPRMANRSGYVAGAPAAEGALPIPGSVVDRYAPNVSVSSGAVAEGAAGVKAPAQATFVKLDKAGWGITGQNLVPGESVHVVGSDGVGQMMRVGRILTTGKDGVQTALLAGESATESALIGNITLTQAEMIHGLSLSKQGYSPSDALKAVLAARTKK